MVGTSVKTPTVVASTAGEFIPNKVIATATASSKNSKRQSLLLELKY